MTDWPTASHIQAEHGAVEKLFRAKRRSATEDRGTSCENDNWSAQLRQLGMNVGWKEPIGQCAFPTPFHLQRFRSSVQGEFLIGLGYGFAIPGVHLVEAH